MLSEVEKTVLLSFSVLNIPMLLSLDNIENALRTKFHRQVIDVGIQQPIDFLCRWSYLSSQVTRFHGAALARIKIPDIQSLLAEIAYGECGSGNRNQIHSKLLTKLISLSPSSQAILQGVDVAVSSLLEDTVTSISQMNQDTAIGFIVGLEAPAYEILHLLKTSLISVNIPEDIVVNSEYMLIHDAVEREHQESGHEAMEIVLQSGCNLQDIFRGGDAAIEFLVDMVGLRSFEVVSR